jgi:hypothetical protein
VRAAARLGRRGLLLAHRPVMRAALVLFLLCAGCMMPEVGDCLGETITSLRDPHTGACIDVGSADACHYCAARTCVVAEPGTLDYAFCGAAAAVDEPACLDLPGHLAVYASENFLACWTTAPSGPVHDGTCVGLGPQECSRHDNCAAWYGRRSDGTMSFGHCADEIRASH